MTEETLLKLQESYGRELISYAESSLSAVPPGGGGGGGGGFGNGGGTSSISRVPFARPSFAMISDLLPSVAFSPVSQSQSWLLRYGSVMKRETALDVLRIRDSLRLMDSQVRWFVGFLVRWFVGSLVRWFVGSLVHWQ